jgi:hypothetical protein
VDWIKYVHTAGFSITNAKLTAEVKSIAYRAGCADPLVSATDLMNSVGGKSWRKGFQKRHPELKKLNTTLMERVRKMSMTKEAIKRYFDLADIGLTGVKPSNTFFADETYIDMHPRKGVQVSLHSLFFLRPYLLEFLLLQFYPLFYPFF